jgi:hypothetical protein
MSASAAPAACASVMPAPIAPRGLVVRSHNAAAPPVANSVARATIAWLPLSGWSARTPMQRPSSVQITPAVARSSTRIRSSPAAMADSSRVMRRPVALPPAWTTRRTECPPSSPRASAP